LVGRETELAQLQKWLKRALGGTHQLVFVTGEAGIGKTTVVDAFVARLSAKSTVWLGRGQCIEHYGQGEPYLPVLEALGRLCREPDGNQLIALLAQHAPTWLVQMPALLPPTDLEALQRRTQGATRERMLRELAEALEVLTTERPLVLWLEDLHWSDVSTLDWLAFVARRREPARLLIIGAYRPVEVIVGDHSLKSVKQELHLHGQCVELPLRFLTEEHVAKYLVRRFAGGAIHESSLRRLAQLIHQRTEGNPLFLVNLVDYLVAQGGLARLEGQWRLRGEVTAVASWAPESLQQMIETQIEQLSPQDRRVLEVASVAGAEFSAAAVAAGVGATVEEVEEECLELARREQFLQARGTSEWPDGTVAARYSFLHALYQEVLYNRLTAGRRRRLHQQIGEREEQAYGERAREIAAELAAHFERGREYRKAVQYLQQAGENAVQRSAHREAISLLTKGLELVKSLSNTSERTQQELRLQIALGWVLMATKGYAAPEVEKTYIQALELSRQVGEPLQLFSALGGLMGVYMMSGRLHRTRELGEQMLTLAQHIRIPTLLLWAYSALGETLRYLGEFALSLEHLERGIVFYNPQKHRPYRGMNDPGVACLSNTALTLWCLGYPDQALKKIHGALTRAQEMSHSFNISYTLSVAASLHQCRREVQASYERAEALITLSTEQGFPGRIAEGTIYRGWALAEKGQGEEGVAQIRQGLAAYRATGAETGRPKFLPLLAEAYRKVGRPKKGLNVLAEALAIVDKNGARGYEAELYRLKGELTLQQFNVQGSKFKVANPQGEAEAEACFHKAIEIARKQQAKSWELRAVMSLAQLWQQQGKRKKARQMLVEIYGWFTEGFDTKDLQEAKALLDSLNRTT
jgi:predicted ATPase